MERMTNKQLRERYAEVFGETTAANNKAWLVKRVTWRLLAKAEGGLSDRARRRAEELANIEHRRPADDRSAREADAADKGGRRDADPGGQ